MKNKFLLMMIIPLLLIACDKEEEKNDNANQTPVEFTASIQPEVATRITVNNGWTGLADSKMAISIDGVVKEYAVNELGEVTSSNPFYWDDKENLTVDAWYPFNGGVKPESITVKTDQSIAANYEASDYLEVVGATVTAKRQVLTFTHRTAKVICTLTSEYEDLQNASIIFHGLNGVDEGNSVTATNKYRALLIPQTIPVGTDFIEVLSGGVSSYVYTLKEALELKKGCSVQVDISITAEGIEAVFTELSSWKADSESPEGNSPEANPGDNGGSWGGGSNESSGGNSPGASPDNGNGNWEGSNEDATGSSNEANPGSGNGNWRGEDETVTGTDAQP